MTVIIPRMSQVLKPRLDEMLEFCSADPVERVFLEDVARRGLGQFAAVAGRPGGKLSALCHLGANVVPAGEGCAAFADATDHRRGDRGRRALARGSRTDAGAA
jgi:hypothetical protein